MSSRFFKNSLFMILCFSCCCLSKTFADHGDHCLHTVGNQSEKVSDEKYYVKSGSIFVSSEALFLCYAGELLPIRSVECDGGGVFVRYNAFIWGFCPLCHLPFTWWGACINPDCPTKQ